MTDELTALQAALGGYEIGARLGAGTFGVVFAARQPLLRRQVALKVLRSDHAASADLKGRFRTEATVLAELDHPHIVKVFEYHEVDDLCVLVMERLDGGDLRGRLGDPPIEVATACTVALAACSALQQAHLRGVLHRDIKPANLMFSSAGILKITDFGIAKVLAGMQPGTVLDTFLGTPSYIAPEQVRGEALGPGVDIYAMATLLYDLLSGQLPHPTDGGPIAVAFRHVTDPPRPLGELAPELPAGLADVVMRGLARAPADRYESAEAFGIAIARAAAELGPRWHTRSGVSLAAPGPILEELLAPSPLTPDVPDPANQTAIWAAAKPPDDPAAAVGTALWPSGAAVAAGAVAATEPPTQIVPVPAAQPGLAPEPPAAVEPAPVAEPPAPAATVSQPPAAPLPDQPPPIPPAEPVPDRPPPTSPAAPPPAQSLTEPPAVSAPPAVAATEATPAVAEPSGRRRISRRSLLAAAAAIVAVGTGGTIYALSGSSDHSGSASGSNRPATTGAAATGSDSPNSSGPDFAALLSANGSGVLRLISNSCSTGHSGTGFLLAPDLVLTAAALLADSVAVSVSTADHEVRTGQVVGLNSDLALIKLAHKLSGHVFTAGPAPQADAAVGAIGYQPADGAVLRQEVLAGSNQDRFSLQSTDGLAATDLGAPVLDASGKVAGILLSTDSSTDAVLSASAVAAAVQPWIATPQSQDPSSCDAANGPADEPMQPGVPDSEAATAAISSTIAAYFSAIDKADYSTSYGLLGPAVQAAIGTLEQFSAGHATTFDFDVRLHSVTRSGSNGSLQAWVSFTSLQAGDHGPQPGQTCSNWSLDYTMQPGSDAYLINGVRAHSGSSPSTGCP